MIASSPITLPGGTIVPAGWRIPDPNKPLAADNYPEPPAPGPERSPLNHQDAPAHPEAVSDEERIRTNAGNPYHQGSAVHDEWNQLNGRTCPTVRVKNINRFAGPLDGPVFTINRADFNPRVHALVTDTEGEAQ